MLRFKNCRSHFLMVLVVVVVVVFSLACGPVRATVSYDDKAFIINGNRRILISGSIHYPRSTPEVPMHKIFPINLFIFLTFPLFPCIPEMWVYLVLLQFLAFSSILIKKSPSWTHQPVPMHMFCNSLFIKMCALHIFMPY